MCTTRQILYYSNLIVNLAVVVKLIIQFFLLDMFIQHTSFLLNKGSQDRRRGILPPAVSIYWYGLLMLV